jgi:hypothetical protein
MFSFSTAWVGSNSFFSPTRQLVYRIECHEHSGGLVIELLCTEHLGHTASLSPYLLHISQLTVRRLCRRSALRMCRCEDCQEHGAQHLRP